MNHRRPDLAQRPVRRSIGRILKEAPGDWLFGRSSGPGDVLGFLVLAGMIIAGHGIGAALAVNWIVSKTPSVVTGIRAIRHREFMMWNRTQLYQRKGFMRGVPTALEVDPNAAGVPPLMRKIITAAENGNRGAALLDDWLSSRARIPGYLLDIGTVLFGTFVMPIPQVVLFPINHVLMQVPNAISIWLSGANRDISRYWRAGARQRASTLRKFYERHPEYIPAETAPRPWQVPMLGELGADLERRSRGVDQLTRHSMRLPLSPPAGRHRRPRTVGRPVRRAPDRDGFTLG